MSAVSETAAGEEAKEGVDGHNQVEDVPKGKVEQASAPPEEQLDGAVAIIDVSRSMRRIHPRFSKALLMLLETNLKSDASVTLVHFSADVEVKEMKMENVAEAVQTPRFGSGTALFDAVEKGIKCGLEKYKTERVIVIILTDGENNKVPLDGCNARAKVNEAKERGWQVVFLGVNQDAFEAGARIGVGADHSLSIGISSQATVDAFEAVSESSRRHVSGEMSGFTLPQRMASNPIMGVPDLPSVEAQPTVPLPPHGLVPPQLRRQ